MDRSYDLVVIGGGPAGYTGALQAARLGARVALVEAAELGGTCLNWGCIPTKSLAESARLWAGKGVLGAMGLPIGNEFNWPAAKSRQEQVVQQLRTGVTGLLDAGKIEVLRGFGRLLGPGRLQVQPTSGSPLQVLAPRILLATGSRPARPPIPGIDSSACVTSDDVLGWQELPRRLVIMGGGVIGVEFAGIFAALGVQVTLVEMLHEILPTADAELAVLMRQELQHLGVRVLTGARVEEIAGEPGSALVALDGHRVLDADYILVATGRRARLNGLESAGLQVERGSIVTNEQGATNLSGVWAAGDVIGGAMLAHAAMAESRIAVHAALSRPLQGRRAPIPACTFGPLDLAQVGLTEAAAVQQNYDVAVGRFPLSHSGRALTLGEPRGLVKVIADRKYGEILGVHILGPHAAELIGQAALAIQLEATVEELLESVLVHPSLSEGWAEALADTKGEAVHLPRRR